MRKPRRTSAGSMWPTSLVLSCPLLLVPSKIRFFAVAWRASWPARESCPSSGCAAPDRVVPDLERQEPSTALLSQVYRAYRVVPSACPPPREPGDRY